MYPLLRYNIFEWIITYTLALLSLFNLSQSLRCSTCVRENFLLKFWIRKYLSNNMVCTFPVRGQCILKKYGIGSIFDITYLVLFLSWAKKFLWITSLSILLSFLPSLTSFCSRITFTVLSLWFLKDAYRERKSRSHGVPWYHDCRIWKGSGCDFPFSSGELKYVNVDIT